MLYERVLLSSTDGAQIPLDTYCPHVSGEIDPDPRRRAVVICPGGGYEFLSEREAEPVALTFAAAGFNAFVVWNRVAPHVYPRPQQDAASAVAYVRKNAARYHVDPDKIAVMGFSAGGHLAASLGVLWPKAELWAPLSLTPEDVKPNAMVLSYPVINGGAKAHRGSFVALSGSKDLSEHEKYSLDKMVTKDTPPAFLWATWDDSVVPVESTLLMAAALRRADVQAEVHIFPHGEHGASLCRDVTSGLRNPQMVLPDCAGWVDMAQRFLRDTMK